MTRRHSAIIYLTPVRHVALVPQNHFLDVRGGVLLDVANPVFDVLEGLFIRYVVYLDFRNNVLKSVPSELSPLELLSTHQHDPHGSAVVGRGDGAKALLEKQRRTLGNTSMETLMRLGLGLPVRPCPIFEA